MPHTSPACWSDKQETGLAVQLPRMRPGWTCPLHPQNKPGTREMWAILHCADEVLNPRVTQAELQSTPACPSYQMTWNSARSSAITAGSLTMREAPAWLLNQGQQWEPRTQHTQPPTPSCCSHPPAWHGLKTSCVLPIPHADSFLWVFIFHLYH